MQNEKIFQGKLSAEKYQSRNPIANYMVRNFLKNISDYAASTKVTRVHEIGCGEGQISGVFARAGFKVRGCDLSETSLAVARSEAEKAQLQIAFKCANIYDLKPEDDSEELVVCCEVLEHLENPEKALSILVSLAQPYLIVSVPNEPLWCCLNMARGKYLKSFGNTPGHIQHWSSKEFMNLVGKFINIISIQRPIPWTVLLCKAKN